MHHVHTEAKELALRIKLLQSRRPLLLMTCLEAHESFKRKMLSIFSVFFFYVENDFFRPLRSVPLCAESALPRPRRGGEWGLYPTKKTT